MRCPRCNFEGELVQGACTHCGYKRTSVSAASFAMTDSSYLKAVTMKNAENALIPGDILHQGRYRLVEQLNLPENQHGQGTAWLATDAQTLSPSKRVIIRVVAFPDSITADKKQLVRSIAARFTELGQHAGFPRLIEVFTEQGTTYLVLQYIEGESLAATMKHHHGILPERMVAEYGQQLCEMLSLLSRQTPPFVHGSITPETIIVSPDQRRVSLIHFPLFTSTELSPNKALPSDIEAKRVYNTMGPASDLYTVTAVLYNAMTGYNPRERTSLYHPPARQLNPVITASMEAILIKGLRLSIAHRYAHPADMQKDLSGLLASQPLQGETIAPVTDALHIHPPRPKRQLRTPNLRLSIALVSLLAIMALTLILAHPFAGSISAQSTVQQTAIANVSNVKQTAIANTSLEMQTFQKKGIGISDGNRVFDTFAGRSDNDFKKQAGQAIQKGDASSAINLLTKAVTIDPTDGEAQIYNENVHILQNGSPYIALVLGLPIDSNTADLGIARTDMESAYLAQHEINTKGLLPRGLKLRLLVGNSGANNDDVAQVGQFIANRVKAGNPDQIIGVVGWPYSSQTINVRDSIAAVHLPLVAQTASSVALSGSNPYFFRVNPPDDLQGKTLGAIAVQRLHAQTILVLRDPTDTYSVSLADSFTASVKALHATAINNSQDYFTETTTTVSDYEKGIVKDALAARADTIFLAGLDVDAVRLAHAVGNVARANPTNTALANLKILGGDAVDTGLLLGQGQGTDAEIAASFPADMQHLIFTAFGHPNEWNFLGIPHNQQPAFFSEWTGTYQRSAIAANNAADAGNDAILTYDAIQVIMYAAKFTHAPLNGQAIRDSLASIGTGSIPAYQGISGRIFFNAQGNPVDKAIVVLNVENNNGVNEIKLNQIAGTFR